MGQPTFHKRVTSWYVGRGQKKGLSSSGPGAKAQRYSGSNTLRTRLSVVIKWRAGMRPCYPAIVLREAHGVSASPPPLERESKALRLKVPAALLILTRKKPGCSLSPSFLNLSTIVIWSETILHRGGSPVYCRMLVASLASTH